MKTIKLMATMLTPVLILAIAFALVGCEDKPDSGGLNANVDTSSLGSGDDLASGLSVIPENPEITHVGQVVELEVRGGHWPYTWRVADSNGVSLVENTIGRIDVIQNVERDIKFTAVYTAKEVAVNTIVVTDGHGRTGTAVVNASSATGPALAITPSSVTVSTNFAGPFAFELKAIGGVPPYDWFNSATGVIDIAELNLAGGNDRVSISTLADLSGTNDFSITISVTDSAEQTVSSTFASE